MNPVDNYVRDFVEDVPRSKVLKASSITTPIDTIKLDQINDLDTSKDSPDNQSLICVVDSDDRLVGVAPYDEIAIAVQQIKNDRPYETILNPDSFCHVNDSLETVLQRLSRNNDQIIVVDSERRVIGKITTRDAVASIIPNAPG